jgi:alpha-tubulin suppressor-like RCC1 family protein
MKRLHTAHIAALVLVVGCDTATTPPVPTAWFAVSAGEIHTCGRAADSSLFCWGLGHGTLGDGTSDLNASPTRVIGGLTFRAVSAGDGHTCAIAEHRAAYCWGHGGWYELGNGHNIAAVTPVLVHGFIPQRVIAAGQGHSCAIGMDAVTRCWGRDSFGQAGGNDPEMVQHPTPVTPTLAFDTLVTGAHHTCGLTGDGHAFCWGRDDHGQLGAGAAREFCDAVPCSRQPVPVAGDLRFTSIAAGPAHTCGVASDGYIHCWGNGASGQLGSRIRGSSAIPVRVAGDRRYRAVAVGDRFSCAIDKDDRAYCWGFNGNGRLGIGSEGADFVLAPSPVAGPTRFRSLSAGHAHACGTGTDHWIHCWGYGAAGALGNGQLADAPAPTPIATR